MRPGAHRCKSGCADENVRLTATGYLFSQGPSLESTVNKVLDNKPTALSAKDVKHLVLEAHGLESFADRLFEILYKKPLEKSRFMAFKVIAVLHALCLEGPPLFSFKVADHKPFLMWVGKEPATSEVSVNEGGDPRVWGMQR